jgi:hypothetical protein
MHGELRPPRGPASGVEPTPAFEPVWTLLLRPIAGTRHRDMLTLRSVVDVRKALDLTIVALRGIVGLRVAGHVAHPKLSGFWEERGYRGFSGT